MVQSNFFLFLFFVFLLLLTLFLYDVITKNPKKLVLLYNSLYNLT